MTDCTSWLGHAWFYKELRNERVSLFIDAYNVEKGEKRICTRCGLIQEKKSYWDEDMTDVGYAEDKKAVVKEWREQHLMAPLIR